MYKTAIITAVLALSIYYCLSNPVTDKESPLRCFNCSACQGEWVKHTVQVCQPGQICGSFALKFEDDEQIFGSAKGCFPKPGNRSCQEATSLIGEYLYAGNALQLFNAFLDKSVSICNFCEKDLCNS